MSEACLCVINNQGEIGEIDDRACPVHGQPAPSAASVLREIEWGGRDGTCLICGGHETDGPWCRYWQGARHDEYHRPCGHTPDCRLAAALQAEDSLRERVLEILDTHEFLYPAQAMEARRKLEQAVGETQ